MSLPEIDVLFYGFPGKGSNTYLGWSTIALLKSEGKKVLVDTGGSGARPMLLEALEERGLRPYDIDYVFLTHLHFDHIANINLFPHATFILSRKEWEYANTRDDLFVMEGSLPLLRSFKKRLVEIDGEELLPGITCLHTPGHTPGCLSLVVDMKEKGRWVIAGDAIKNRQELRSGEVGMTLEAETSNRTIQGVRKMASRVLPGHDCWLTIENEEVRPEMENEVVITLPEGITINGVGAISLKLDNN